ncbi:hypothetical protein LXL04_017181 [Taraxacum kok-saghyz]
MPYPHDRSIRARIGTLQLQVVSLISPSMSPLGGGSRSRLQIFRSRLLFSYCAKTFDFQSHAIKNVIALLLFSTSTDGCNLDPYSCAAANQSTAQPQSLVLFSTAPADFTCNLSPARLCLNRRLNPCEHNQNVNPNLFLIFLFPISFGTGDHSMGASVPDLKNVNPNLSGIDCGSHFSLCDLVKSEPANSGNPFPKVELIDPTPYESTLYTDSIICELT